MDSEFRPGAAIECTNGPAGKLRQLVVDPTAVTVTHLVVDSTEHFGIRVLVPATCVTEAKQEQVRLSCSQDELQQMDPFERVVTPGERGQEAPPGMTTPLAPAAGLGQIAAAGSSGPLGLDSATAPIIEEVVPEGEVVIGHASIVQASDGDVGHVEAVSTDPASGRLTNLEVRSGHFWATHTFRLPATAVEDVQEGAVRLRMTQAEVEAIAKQEDKRP